MTWAGRRRALIIGIIAAVVLAVAIFVYFHTAYTPPSCVDGIQNQGEQGIDCGGPCPYLCTESEQAPVVRFTQEFTTTAGLTDVIAYIDNPNQGAYARNVSYSVSLYGANHTLGAPTMSGTVDIPAGASVPVFIPNISSGKNAISSAFLTLDPSTIRWQSGSDTRVIPRAESAVLGGTTAAPRITAELDNSSTAPMSNVKVIAALFDAAGNVITASQTLLESIPAQGSAVATFTWNAPFSAAPARVDILPIIPLAQAQ